MQNITIAGAIGKDAVTRQTQGGDDVTSWSVATTIKKGQESVTTWWDCSLWGKRGKALQPYLTKGGKVCVTGVFGTRVHEGKTYMTVSVAEVSLLGGGEKRDDEPRQSQQSSRSDMDDEIPF